MSNRLSPAFCLHQLFHVCQQYRQISFKAIKRQFNLSLACSQHPVSLAGNKTIRKKAAVPICATISVAILYHSFAEEGLTHSNCVCGWWCVIHFIFHSFCQKAKSPNKYDFIVNHHEPTSQCFIYTLFQ